MHPSHPVAMRWTGREEVDDQVHTSLATSINRTSEIAPTTLPAAAQEMAEESVAFEDILPGEAADSVKRMALSNLCETTGLLVRMPQNYVGLEEIREIDHRRLEASEEIAR